VTSKPACTLHHDSAAETSVLHPPNVGAAAGGAPAASHASKRRYALRTSGNWFGPSAPVDVMPTASGAAVNTGYAARDPLIGCQWS